MFDRYEWLISLHFPEEYAECQARCIDNHWKEINEIIEEDRRRRTLRKSDYYESEGIDCDVGTEYRRIKEMDEHYIDLWL